MAQVSASGASRNHARNFKDKQFAPEDIIQNAYMTTSFK